MDNYQIKLSPYSRMFYIEWLLNPDKKQYNLSSGQVLYGKLDINRLNQAIRRYIAQHVLVNSHVKEINGEFCWVKNRYIAELEYLEHDITKEELAEYIGKKFDLNQGPLCRFMLVQVKEDVYKLISVTQHLLMDALSVNEGLFSTLSKYYNDETYCIDYTIEDQLELLHAFSAKLNAQLEQNKAKCSKFWQEYLVKDSAISLDFLRLSHLSKEAMPQYIDVAEVRFSYGKVQLDQLSQLRRHYQVTPYMYGQCILAMLLHRYSGQSNFVISYPVAIKPRMNMIYGGQVNTSFMPYQFHSGSTIIDLFDQYRKFFKLLKHDDFNYSYYPVTEVITSDTQYRLNIFFNQTSFVHNKFEFTGINQVEIIENINLDLTGLMPFEQELKNNQLNYRLRYDKNSLDTDLVNNFIECYQRVFSEVLDDLVNDTLKPIADYSILSTEQYQTVMHEWNNTITPDKVEATLHSLFEQQALKTPQAIALIVEDKLITYQELNTRANKLAGYIQEALIIKPDDLVAIYMDRNEYLIIAILAVLKAGGAYVPLEPGHADSRTLHILKETKARLILTNNVYQDKLYALLAKDAITTIAVDKLVLNDLSTNQPCINNQSNNLAVVIYTSGTTGVAKGVMLEHKGIVNRLSWGLETYPFTTDEIACFKTSINFVDHIAEIFTPLTNGIPLVVCGDFVLPHNFDLSKFIDAVNTHKVSRLVIVPALLELILHSVDTSKLASIKYYFCSGEKLNAQVVGQFKDKLPNASLINIYGSSEVSADATAYVVAGKDPVLQLFADGLQLVNKQYTNHLPSAYYTYPDTDNLTLINMFSNQEIPDEPVTYPEYMANYINSRVIPYSVNCSSPKFIGHMTSVLPDMTYRINELVGLLNQNVVKIETSKSLTFVEREALAMLHKVFYKYSPEFYATYFKQPSHSLGAIVSGGTIANCLALWIARNKCLGPNLDYLGVDKEGLIKGLLHYGYTDSVILVSPLAHYSFEKTASLLGIGKNNLIYLDTDQNNVVDIHLLRKTVQRCINQRMNVIALVGIAGATESGTIDPLWEMSQVAVEFKLHFHVDAAFGGSFIFSGKYSGLLKGIECADTITICGHKQLYLPMGISICLFKNYNATKSITTLADYQATKDSFDFGKESIEGSRPAMSLILHANLYMLGKSGYNKVINTCMQNTGHMTDMIRHSKFFELVNVPVINIINYRYIPAKYRQLIKTRSVTPTINQEIDLINRQIQSQQFKAGNTFISKTILPSKIYESDIFVFRAVLCNPLTTQKDIQQVLQEQITIAETLCSQSVVPMAQLHLNMLPINLSVLQQSLIGKPISNMQVYVLDQNLMPLPIGVTGELYLSGVGLARGYLNNKPLTNEHFIPNLFQGAKEKELGINSYLYKSGDLARWLPDGNLEYIGRNDSQIKIRGYRIELAEIEVNLTGYSGIEQAVVLALQDSNKAESDNMVLIGYYTAESELNEEHILNYLSRLLPEYMLPQKLVYLNIMPLTTNGKIDRRALPIPDFTDKNNYVAPRNENERLICNIYAEVLNLSPEVVGANTDFFKVGGNSLLAIKLVTKLQSQFQISVNEIFRLRTPAKIAEFAPVVKDNLTAKLEQIKLIYSKSLNSNDGYDIQKYNTYLEEAHQSRFSQQLKDINKVLLTGSTGYLGCNILYQLLNNSRYKLYLLIRAGSNEEAYTRLNEKFNYYFGLNLDVYHDRLVVLAADLESTTLGLNDAQYSELAANIDSIIHSAALVKHYGNYDEFYRANVQATINLLELSRLTRLRDFHYISTKAIFLEGYISNCNYYAFTENDNNDILKNKHNFYLQTKHEGELITVKYREYGVNSNIYRVGNLVMNSQNYHIQENITDNAFFQRIQAVMRLGIIPQEFETVEISPVDSTALAITLLFNQQELINQAFHVFNPYQVSVTEFLTTNETDLKVVTFNEFIDNIIAQLQRKEDTRQIELLMLHQGWLEDIGMDQVTQLHVLQNKTEAVLAHLGFKWPAIKGEMLSHFIKRSQFLKMTNTSKYNM